MKILLCGHACGPELGSEPGLTWNWAWHLSERHQVWALVHPHHRFETEAFLREHPNGNLKFIWVSLPRLLDPWRPSAGDWGLRLHYIMWQRAAYRRARRLNRQVGFDICHHVSWATVNSASLLWKLPVPFFWGPVGGGQTAPRAFREYFGSWWSREAIRNIQVGLRRMAPSLRRIIRSSAYIFASNSDTKALLEGAGAERVSLFIDNGLPQELFRDSSPERNSRDQVVLHWSGRILPQKALPLALQGFARALKDGDLNLHLEISGDGPERRRCEKLAADLGIDERVRFLGRIPRTELFERFRRADVFLFTSLRDSCASVCLEAMAQALPVIVIDHQGARDFIPTEASWKVPLTNPSGTLERLAAAIRSMAIDPKDRVVRGRAALEFAKSESWPLRVKRMEDIYERYRRSPPCLGPSHSGGQI